jgi:hypothetical protein
MHAFNLAEQSQPREYSDCYRSHKYLDGDTCVESPALTQCHSVTVSFHQFLSPQLALPDNKLCPGVKVF